MRLVVAAVAVGIEMEVVMVAGVIRIVVLVLLVVVLQEVKIFLW